MEGQEQLSEPPPLPLQPLDPIYFSPTLPPPSLLPQPMQTPNQVGPDFDWLGFFSGSISNDVQMQPITSSTMSEADINVRKIKGKSNKTKKSTPHRIAFHTKSPEDILDDGFKWRKYGQKSVKYSTHPRSYYRCTHHTCNVKKQIQRHSKDTTIVVTTYEGIHNHPCEKLMESLSPLLRQLQYLSRF